jgi:uncharacterized membrane protein
MKGFRWLNVLDVLMMVTLFAVAFWIVSRLPATVPVHFGFSGLPDRTSPRAQAAWILFLLPMVWVFNYVLLRIFANTDAQGRQNSKVLEQVSSVLMVFALALELGIGFSMLSGTAFDMLRLVLAGLGVLFALMGSALPRTRPNVFVGIRLFYTLSSDLAWQKIHRMGGWWMTVYGLVLLGISLIPLERVAAFTVLSLPVVVLAGLFVLNARAKTFWTQDPARRSAR